MVEDQLQHLELLDYRRDQKAMNIANEARQYQDTDWERFYREKK